MGEHNQSGEGAGPSGRLAWTENKRSESRTGTDRESQQTGIWRRPGAGAVPTRPVETLFDFSTHGSHDSIEAASRLQVMEERVFQEARNRAFALLDDWLTWISIMEDESVFAGGRSGPRGARYAFQINEILADPVDVVRYSGRTSPFL